MKITDLRIGNKVQDKYIKLPMTVIGLSKEGVVSLISEGDESGIWKYSPEELEFYEPRYKLPEWKKGSNPDDIVSSISSNILKLKYELKSYNGTIRVFFNRNIGSTTNIERIGEFSTLHEAKEFSEKHYNELVSELIEKLTSVNQ